MYIAEGNESLDDCDIFTWSFGCTGALLPSAVPASWQDRFEITSLKDIDDDVKRWLKVAYDRDA